jgi:hypothetical protein
LHMRLYGTKDKQRRRVYPMLDQLGYPTFDKTRVRSPRAYFQLAISGY